MFYLLFLFFFILTLLFSLIIISIFSLFSFSSFFPNCYIYLQRIFKSSHRFQFIDFILLRHSPMNTVESAINAQRANIKFNPQKISQFLYGVKQYAALKKTLKDYDLPVHDFNIFNKSRQDIIKQAVRDMPIIYNNVQDKMTDPNFIYYGMSQMFQSPGTVHFAMFMKCIEYMGTEEQKKQYIAKCKNFQIVGSYAQTQMAHGSDVSSLLTTATFNPQKDEFIIDTPDIKAIKFWPGELGLFSNHALVFAQLIINNKNYGVQSFVVRIRDQNMKPMPGIEVGDIGPKIGYCTRDNGYLILNKISVPRKNMLARYVSVDKNGQVKTKGNPKVGYATMMLIRKHISSSAPKIYACAITIATKYSLFRKQFKNEKKQEIKIMDYQLQQQKIIERIAEYFAITLAGNKVNKVSTLNEELVRQKSDFTLMQEAHLCLSLGKPYFSQIVYDGMEICRKACGGHGFSHYSGFPAIIADYAANLTHEGQNTVLYLQVARSLMKNYKGMVVNNKKISGSIEYLQNFSKLLEQKCQTNEPQKWTTSDIKKILSQSVCYLISVASQKIVTKQEGMSQKQVFDKIAGINLKDMAIAHSAYFCFDNFKNAVDKQTDPKIKQITQALCLLYGANFLVTRGLSAVQAGFLTKEQLRSLNDLKQILLKKLRPDIIGIVDGFGIPDKYIRSALTYGNPYENFIKLARQNEINHTRMPSVEIVKDIKNHMKNPNPAL